MGLILSDKQEVEIGKKVKVFICSTVGSRVGGVSCPVLTVHTSDTLGKTIECKRYFHVSD